MDDRPPFPHYNPDYCRKVTKWAASICVGWLAIQLFILIFVSPANGSCSGWRLHIGEPSETSMWLVTGLFTGLPTAWIVYIALNWEYFSRKYYDSIADAVDRDPRFLWLDANRLYLEVNVGLCLFCALPLLFMIRDCASLFPALGIP